MSDASGASNNTARPHRGSETRSRDGRRKFGAGAAIGVGVVVFSLLVWAAFSLGFERMQADLGIAKKTSLEATPIVTFDAEDQGWTLVRPANTQRETGPQFGTVSSTIEAMCVFTWSTTKSEDETATDAETDEHATLETLEDEGYDVDGYGIVRLVSESGQSIELVYVRQEAAAGLDTVVAARTFAGSGDSMIFTMKCDSTGELDQEVFQDTLLGVEIHLSLAS